MHAITYANYVIGLGKIGIIRNTFEDNANLRIMPFEDNAYTLLFTQTK